MNLNKLKDREGRKEGKQEGRKEGWREKEEDGRDGGRETKSFSTPITNSYH